MSTLGGKQAHDPFRLFPDVYLPFFFLSFFFVAAGLPLS